MRNPLFDLQLTDRQRVIFLRLAVGGLIALLAGGNVVTIGTWQISVKKKEEKAENNMQVAKVYADLWEQVHNELEKMKASCNGDGG